MDAFERIKKGMKPSKPPALKRELESRQSDPKRRRWLFVPYDQLSDAIGPLSREDPSELGIVLLECPWKAAQRPYHKQKLALVLANLRHFALEQAERGVAVDHRVVRGTYGEALRDVAREKGKLRCMRPAERELRQDLAALARHGRLELLPHEGWLTTREQFDRSQASTPWRMDRFYREVRREGGWLMEDGKPLGGKFSFDTHNREPWSGTPAAPQPPEFESDEVTAEVFELIEERYGEHPGELDPASLPATLDQAEELWTWAKEACLPFFGPYEDAMSTRSRTLFHTRVSALIHLHRLLPRRLVQESCELDIELRSKEGFLRQVLGWREFMRHVHDRTDGFRSLPEGFEDPPCDANGQAAPSRLGSHQPLPQAFWGEASGLHCLDRVVASVWDEAYSHHITRLMVLSNLATLLDVSPRELTDWFWVAYADAYDWVVEPNVLAMGTFGVGDLLTTKPYVSGAAYIDRMSDYCGSCAFQPKKNCPVTPLYWAFLERHRAELESNPRLRMPYASLGKRGPEKRRRDRAMFEHVQRLLASGERLTPQNIQEVSA